MFAQASSGNPTRFLTLTVNPAIGDSPDDRLKLLAYSWRIIVKRLRRAHRGQEVEYFAVVEETKRGEPHLHILLRSPFISQSFLSDCMAELAQSPIVDIRKIKGVAQAVRYVAKYIGKKPAQFGTSKRYWHSSRYFIATEESEQYSPANRKQWRIWRDGVTQLLQHWIEAGYAGRKDGELGLKAIVVQPELVSYYLQRQKLSTPEPRTEHPPRPSPQGILSLNLAPQRNIKW